jgi:hypothetical protein
MIALRVARSPSGGVAIVVPGRKRSVSAMSASRLARVHTSPFFPASIIAGENS